MAEEELGVSEHTYEVAYVTGPGSRVVLGRELSYVEAEAMFYVAGEYVWSATFGVDYSPGEHRAYARLKDSLGVVPDTGDYPRIPGVSVTRSDATPEAIRAQWESEFYDIDKAGRRRRRYRKTPLEREWEQVMKDVKAEKPRAKRLKTQHECDSCGARWSIGADKYGLVHDCERGLVKLEEEA